MSPDDWEEVAASLPTLISGGSKDRCYGQPMSTYDTVPACCLSSSLFRHGMMSKHGERGVAVEARTAWIEEEPPGRRPSVISPAYWVLKKSGRSPLA